MTAAQERAIALLRRGFWPSMLLMGSYVIAVAAPRAMVFAVLIAGGAAFLGSTKGSHVSARATVRSIILAWAAFSYLLFLGGTILPWAGVLMTSVLLIAGWCAEEPARAMVMRAQLLAGVIAIALAATAAQFFFPAAWAWVDAVAIITLAALIWTALEHGTSAAIIHVAIIALLCTEALFVLRALPAHWIINGTVLAFAIAAMMEHHRTTRFVYIGSLLILITIGIW